MSQTPTADVEKRATEMHYLSYSEPEPEPEPPPPPPKKKKKKLSKAQKRELRLQREIAFKKLEITEHLKRELELSKRSAKRGREDWEQICREIKMQELKTEVTEWAKKTQRVMEQKDEKVQNLLADIESTQEMHKRNFERHLQVLDFAINCYNTLIEVSKQLYESQAQQVIEEFKDELNSRKEIEDGFRLNCENIMHATNLVVEHQMLTDYEIFIEKQDDVVNSEIEKRFVIRDAVIAKMKLLHKQLIDFINSLVNVSLDTKKYEHIHMLMERQRNFVSESGRLNDIEFKLTRTAGDLQRDLVHNEVEAQRRLSDLRLEQEYFLQVRKSIEKSINYDRNVTFEKLQTLSGECYGMLKDYQKLLKYGELLLSNAANCRKLQTEAEKVEAPKDEGESAAEELSFQLEALNLKSHADMSEVELAKQMALMKNFWHRQALASTQNLLLAREKRELLEENQKYKDFIKLMSKRENIDDMLKTFTVTPLLAAKDRNCLENTLFQN
ncbi:coiled-coil domain-containing protein 65 [Ceratitis capitata]|uniref:coiled-coil domain-containing protein 65 n=1 Tax=Ceratitis capitata TaxID=7213 RepID=UPI00032A1135|nr:coiled-coil domain-containing protein 65 [Ceratitis capitata]